MRLYDYAASANCYKVRLLLAHLGTEYERVPIDIFGGDTLTDEFAAINAARTTPVLEDPPGTFLQESNAILLRLARDTPYLPDDPQVFRWLFYEQADVVPTSALTAVIYGNGASFALSAAGVIPTSLRLTR